MALTPLHLRDVCYGNGWTGKVNDNCKYLQRTVRSDGKYVSVCTKLNVAAYDKLKKTQQGSGYGEPKGDNCKGYLYLLFKDQGYDV